MMALLICLAFAAPAVAQEEEPEEVNGFLQTAPGAFDDEGNRLPDKAAFPNLQTKARQSKETSPDCRTNIISIVFHYPQGTGLADLDKKLETMAAEDVNRLIKSTKDGFCAKDDCSSLSCGKWEAERRYAVYSPSAGYLSILFSDFLSFGGAHPNREYRVLNYGKDGTPLTLQDVFADPDKSAPLYWEYVYSRWCAENGYKFPLHYSMMQPCEKEDDPENPSSYKGTKTIEDLGRLVFTPNGASLLLGPYESGSNATGTVVLDLPKDELIKMGASKAIWGE